MASAWRNSAGWDDWSAGWGAAGWGGSSWSQDASWSSDRGSSRRWGGGGKGSRRGQRNAKGDDEEPKKAPNDSKAAEQGNSSASSSAPANGTAAKPSAAATAEWTGPPPKKLAVVFCKNPGPGKFTSLYEADPPMENFASVNAGNGRKLHIGGSGINGQFERELSAARHPIAEYQKVHQLLMNLACKVPGELVRAPEGSLERHTALTDAFAMVQDSEGHGFVVVDVFRPDLRPLHQENVAMVYCVGPDRREHSSDDSFVAALQQLGESVAHACNCYNAVVAEAHVDGSLPPLWRVRMSLVSGGKYAGKVPKPIVARTLLRGLVRGTAAATSGDGVADELEFELTYDEGVFEAAWNELREAGEVDV
eukprot:TRINITY_DN124118_c0_g1_i1.p1 TRINITY_DN124118_c0_g1~~TRINITY_DN124118_c0_g1_i1.p1  ORF type:complete len:365 (-),score=86.31 TRINITY_DN124118_c0_g1_i1:40-1134(-)